MKSTMSFISLYAAVVLTLVSVACNNESKNTAISMTNSEDTITSARGFVFDKLVGTWQSEDGGSFERWTKNNDNTYRSVAFSVKKNDTSWNEQAAIYLQNNQWIFENIVKGQNDGKAIKFGSILLNDTTVQFSNPAHDFPTDIYYRVTDTTINAFITGPNNKGGKDTIRFNYRRFIR